MTGLLKRLNHDQGAGNIMELMKKRMAWMPMFKEWSRKRKRSTK
jgi:hypothetical protein